jgi:DNA polymerase-3 subunit alpha
VNKRTLEALICAGAFDTMYKNRAALFSSVERLIIFGQSMQEHSSRHQSGLFGSSTKHDEHIKFPPLDESKRWSHFEQLAKEKSVLGFYVSGHPLEKYEFEAATFSTTNFSNTSSVKHESTVKACGLISQVRKKPDKKGNMMAFMTLEDFYGKCECIVFSKTFANFSSLINEDNIVMVIGNADTNSESLKILVNEIIPIENVFTKFAKGISIALEADSSNEKTISELKTILSQSSGTCSCFIDVKGLNGNGTKRYRATKFSVTPTNELIAQLQNNFGREAVNILL